MSFKKQGDVAGSHSLLERVTACAAVEQIDDPYYWTYSRAWQLSAQPGWVEAFIGSASDDPGGDEDAITDDMIRAAVLALSTPPETHSV